jgi:hypothetical protein
MASLFRSVWFRRGLLLFAAVIVLRGIAERRPDKVVALGLNAFIFLAVIVLGWMFAIRRED